MRSSQNEWSAKPEKRKAIWSASGYGSFLLLAFVGSVVAYDAFGIAQFFMT